MPRRETVKIEEYPALMVGQVYTAIVFHIEKKRRPPHLEVGLRNLHRSQDGREHFATLPLPALPQGRTAGFFRVCGLAVEAGRSITLNETLGKVVLVRFGQGAGEEPEIIEFKQPSKEKQNGAEHG